MSVPFHLVLLHDNMVAWSRPGVDPKHALEARRRFDRWWDGCERELLTKIGEAAYTASVDSKVKLKGKRS